MDARLLSETIDTISKLIKYVDDGSLNRELDYELYKDYFDTIDYAKDLLMKLVVLNDKDYVYELLDNIKNKKQNVNYEIYASFQDFDKYVELGRNKKESLQIFMMCYMATPGIEQLEEWTLQDLICYIKDTDSYYKEDMQFINKCMNIINRKEEQ